MTDEDASNLAKKRWSKTTPEQRAAVARALNEARYENMPDEERKAIGKRLAAARAKKVKPKPKPKKKRAKEKKRS